MSTLHHFDGVRLLEVVFVALSLLVLQQMRSTST